MTNNNTPSKAKKFTKYGAIALASLTFLGGVGSVITHITPATTHIHASASTTTLDSIVKKGDICHTVGKALPGFNQLGETDGFSNGTYFDDNTPAVYQIHKDFSDISLEVLNNENRDWVINVPEREDGHYTGKITMYYMTKQDKNNEYHTLTLNVEDVENSGNYYKIDGGTTSGGNMQKIYIADVDVEFKENEKEDSDDQESGIVGHKQLWNKGGIYAGGGYHTANGPDTGATDSNEKKLEAVLPEGVKFEIVDGNWIIKTDGSFKGSLTFFYTNGKDNNNKYHSTIINFNNDDAQTEIDTQDGKIKVIGTQVVNLNDNASHSFGTGTGNENMQSLYLAPPSK